MLFATGGKVIPVKVNVHVARGSIDIAKDNIVTTNVIRSAEYKLSVSTCGQSS